MNKIKIIKTLKAFFSNTRNAKEQKIVIVQKTCTHCINRGMFIFENNSPEKIIKGRLTRTRGQERKGLIC